LNIVSKVDCRPVGCDRPPDSRCIGRRGTLVGGGSGRRGWVEEQAEPSYTSGRRLAERMPGPRDTRFWATRIERGFMYGFLDITTALWNYLTEMGSSRLSETLQFRVKGDGRDALRVSRYSWLAVILDISA
jgi:hypothetical protein